MFNFFDTVTPVMGMGQVYTSVHIHGKNIKVELKQWMAFGLS